MISVEEDNEFTVLFADVIQTMSGLGRFKLVIWLTGSELPFEYTDDSDFHFLQEGIRIKSNNTVEYIFYDTITYLKVVSL